MKRLVYFMIFFTGIIASDIEVPSIFSVSALDPVGFFIKWTVVASGSDNPILGYKIRLWEIEEHKQGYFNLVNGEQTPGLLMEDRPLEPVDKHKLPKGHPREVVVDGVSTEKAKVYDIKYDTLYEIRILAYKVNEDGALSEPVRIKIMKGDAYLVVIQKRPEDACAVSIATNVTIDEEAYYHLETMYL